MSSKRLTFGALGLLAALASSSTPQAWASFVHTATPANTVGHITYLDVPEAQGDPSRLFIVTPMWNPIGGWIPFPNAGTYNDHPIGVWYDHSRDGGRWAIFNQDSAAMPIGASFFVFPTRPSESSFVQRCVAANIRRNSCYIENHSVQDGLIFITSNFNPGGSGGVYNNHHTGVWYDVRASQWAVFNQDRGEIDPGAAFNVLIMPPGSGRFVHRASDANNFGNSTYLTELANRPQTEVGYLLVTPFYNPGSGDIYSYSLGMYYNRAFGVWFSPSRQQWAIFSQDRQPMPAGVGFNVYILYSP